MAGNVGQAHLKNINEVIGFAPGQLSSEFANGGISEIEASPNGEVLSMEDFLKAEESLEHAPSSIREIEEVAVNAVAHLEQKLERTTFLYSQKETGREQNGGLSDDNTVTDIGRLKVGIQDEAYRRKEEKKRNQYRVLDIAMQQASEMSRLQERMNQLLSEINKLENEIDELKEDSKLAEELIENIDDLNSDNSDVRTSARKKTRDYLANHNIDIDDFIREDGSICTEDVLDALRHQHSENEENIRIKTEKWNQLNEEMSDLESGLGESEQDSTYDSSPYDDNVVDVSDAAEDSEFDNIEDGAFDIAFGSNYSYAPPLRSELNKGEISKLAEFDASSTVGSFAGTGEENKSIISGHFTTKANSNFNDINESSDLQQGNEYSPVIAMNGPT